MLATASSGAFGQGFVKEFLKYSTLYTTGIVQQPVQLSKNSLSSAINTGVVIVEFGVEFGVEFAQPFSDWASVEDCEYYRIDIGEYPDVKKKYKVRFIPTLILFNNGVKVDVWKANIMLELDVTADEIQSSIDAVLSDKF